MAKALRRGEPVAAQDQPVAAAIVTLLRRQRWLPGLYALTDAIWLINAFTHHGIARWLWWGLVVCYLVLVVVTVRQQRRIISTYDRNASTDGAGRAPDTDLTSQPG